METVVVNGIRARVARTFPQRARGLIGTKDLAPDEGMLILKCNPIDATFLDKNDRVVRVVRNIRPWRLFVWGGWRAKKVLETKSNSSSSGRRPRLPDKERNHST